MELDWKNLGFGYMKTDYNIRSYFRDGAWTTPVLTSDEMVNLHMARYGSALWTGCFRRIEGVFVGLTGRCVSSVLKRMRNGCAARLRICGWPNRRSNSSWKWYAKWSRPMNVTSRLMNGRIALYPTGFVRVGASGWGETRRRIPADYLCDAGSPYYKEGFNPIKVIIDRDHDRAAPLGTGHIKAGGNYGASLISSEEAHKKGYPSVLYLDAREKKYIDESGAANFFAIRDGKYITPKSHSNSALHYEPESDDVGQGVGAGSRNPSGGSVRIGHLRRGRSLRNGRAVISPIGSVFDPETNHTYVYNNGESGPWCQKLYHKLRAIQYGEEPDKYGWNLIL